MLCACCCPKVLSHRSFHNSSRRIAAVTPVADEEKGPKRVNRVPEAMQLVSGAAGAELWTSQDRHAGGHEAVVHIEFLPASVSGCFWFFVIRISSSEAREMQESWEEVIVSSRGDRRLGPGY